MPPAAPAALSHLLLSEQNNNSPKNKIGVWYICMYVCMYVCLYLCTYVCDFAVFTTFTSIISKFRTKFYIDLSTYLHMLVFACVSTTCTYVVVCMCARPIVCDYNEIWKFARNISISVFFRRSCWRLAWYFRKPKSSQNESPIIKVHFLFIKKEGSLKRFTKKFVFFLLGN